MSADADLAELAAHVGVFSEFTDMQHQVHKTSVETQRAFLRANGFVVDHPAEVSDSLAQIRAEATSAYVTTDVVIASYTQTVIPIQQPHTGTVSWTVIADGTTDTVLAQGRAETTLDLPELASGVHLLHLEGSRGSQNACLITAPAASPSLTTVSSASKTWGIVAALYGLARAPSQGVGDFEDLHDMVKVAGAHGAGFLGINPVHALGWAAPDTISPYSPTHRGFLNTSHIAIGQFRSDSSASQSGLLDYVTHAEVHRAALRRQFGAFQQDAPDSARAAFAEFCTQEGQALLNFAAFEVLSETHGPDWRMWPAALQQPSSELIETSAAQGAFHMWLQWRASQQLAAAQTAAQNHHMALGLYLDLAVGARLGGAESWGRATATATGVSLGAPPDQLSPAGQNWQLAALSPRKLSAGRYAAFRQILAQNLRHCGVLRIDHALGLNRSFWIPEDGSPGGYMRQPFQSLMGVIAIEAEKANSVIIGEDLGLVPHGFRDALAQGGLYGYTVLQYEKNSQGQFLPTDDLRAQSLACFGTHDTPTLQGYWTGHDIDWWRKLSWITDVEESAARATRVQEKAQLLDAPAGQRSSDHTAKEVRDMVHRRLANTPAQIVAVQLDDILCVTEAQNLPGTVDDHPNWRRRCPLTIPEIAASGDLKATAEIMAQAGRGPVLPTKRKEIA